MFDKSIYVTIYKQDYIWYEKPCNFRLSQKPTCKRLSIPKYITQHICHKKYIVPWKY